MSSQAFHEIFLHFNWHVKTDCCITPECEAALYADILSKCRLTDGVIAHGIGGTETHIHLAISIEPTVNISTFIGQVKGHSTFEVNKQDTSQSVNWKRGYGVVSFSKGDLPWVLAYIANQKEHHCQGTISPKLKRTQQDDRDA